MSRFTIRVELYGNPDYQTYNTLHERMLKGGYSRQITYDKKTYWLPNAEYTCTLTNDAETIKNSVVKIATTVWDDFGVLVTQSEVDRARHNLKPVT